MQFIVTSDSLERFEKTIQIHLDSGCTVVHLQVAGAGNDYSKSFRYLAILKKPDGNF